MVRRVGCALATLLSVAGTAVPVVAGAATTRVSVSGSGAQANAASGEGGVAISADGRYVAFASDASNLVAGDTNGVSDVFVRDARLHTTFRVSVSTAGAEANDASTAEALALSPGGRFVTFMSTATNLAPGNDDSACAPDRCPDVFLHDLRSGRTTMLVPFPGGPPPRRMALSDGARFYAYDNTVFAGVERCRRSTHRCVLASVLPRGIKVDEADPNAFLGGLSAGGRFVLFKKVGFNEAPHPTSLIAGGVFVRDVAAGRTYTVTAHTRDTADALSPNGRFVLFSSRSPALVRGDTNRRRDVFVRDRRTGSTHRVSVSSRERQANGESIGVGISSGGRFCLFASTATGLVGGDRNGVRDLFVRNRRLGRTTRVDVATSGAEADAPVRFAALASGGRWAAFGSTAASLVPGDSNAVRDVFLAGPVR